ncbi:hypothetical protein C0991_003374, partial [Blastosporella zonata]
SSDTSSDRKTPAPLESTPQSIGAQHYAKAPTDAYYRNLLRSQNHACSTEANIAFAAAQLRIDLLDGYQVQGLGQRLISKANEYLKGENIAGEGIWLGMDPKNTNAKAFPKSLEFKEIESAPDKRLLRPLQ